MKKIETTFKTFAAVALASALLSSCATIYRAERQASQSMVM